VWHIVSYSIFGASMVLLYGFSALYHLLPVSDRARLVLRRIDHLMIFVLICGTYTPFCLVTLRGGWGWSIAGVIWGLTLFGFAQSIFWVDAPRWLSTGAYLFMGWIAVIAIYPLAVRLSGPALSWLVAGGVLYSAGAVIYGLKRPDPVPGVFGFHEIWHMFVLAGTASHFFSIAQTL
jgi:hemolysin III